MRRALLVAHQNMAHLVLLEQFVVDPQDRAAGIAEYDLGEDAFQECDAVGITRPCVKHNFLVRDVKDLAVTMKKAFHIATTGRPGPVLVDIPKDVTVNKCEFQYPETVSMRSYNPVKKGHAGQIKKAVDRKSVV